MDKKKAIIYALITVVLWASVAAVSKLLLRGLDNMQLLFCISLLSAVSLGALLLAQGKKRIALNYTIKDHARFALLALLGTLLYYLLLFKALELSTAQEAFIVNSTWPLWTVIFASLLLHERFTWRKTIALVLGFVGVIIITTQGGFMMPQYFFGDMLALGAAICYGIYSALGKKYRYEQTTLMFFAFLYATVMSGIVMMAFSSMPSIPFSAVLGVVWLGVFATALPSLTWFLALEHGETGLLSNIMFLTPFLSLVYVYFLLGERILLSSVFGLLCIVAGIAIQNARSR